MPSFRALETDLLVPVPVSAAQITRSSLVQGVNDTSSILGDNESLIASSAGSVSVEGLAVLVQSLADSVVIELPPFRTSETDLLVPVPLGTAVVGGASELSLHTLSVTGQIVALVAGQAASIDSVPGVTVVVDRLTLAVDSGEGSIRA